MSFLLALAGWGATHLGEPQPGEIVPSSSLALALRAMFNAEAAAGLTAAWEIRAAGTALYAMITEGRVTTGVGRPPREADLIMTIPVDEVPTFEAILQAVGTGALELEGNGDLAETFLNVFSPARAPSQS